MFSYKKAKAAATAPAAPIPCPTKWAAPAVLTVVAADVTDDATEVVEDTTEAADPVTKVPAPAMLTALVVAVVAPLEVAGDVEVAEAPAHPAVVGSETSASLQIFEAVLMVVS